MSAGREEPPQRRGAQVPFMEDVVEGQAAEAGRAEVTWSHTGQIVVDAAGKPVAAARSEADARRIAAAINTVYGMPTEALEAWSVGRIVDPVNDVLEEIEAVVAPPEDEERRRGPDRRQGERRRALTEVHIDREGTHSD